MPDGSVAITYPARECIDALASGGNVSSTLCGRDDLRAWIKQHFPHCTAQSDVSLDIVRAWEVSKLLSDRSWRPDIDADDRDALAKRWVDALIVGGLSEMEAMALIFEISAPAYSVAREVWDVSDVPSDRSNRQKWRRSANGGPIRT
jgi:hypothetical protein